MIRPKLKSWTIHACMGLALFLAMPTTAMAQVYKCSGAGHSVYQDTPCKDAPTAAPYIAGPDSAVATPNPPTEPVAAPDPSVDVPSLLVAVQMAKGEQQHLQIQHDKDLKALRAKMKGAAPGAEKQAEQALAQTWSSRLEAASQHEAQLMAQLHKQCPGGVDMDSPDHPCVGDIKQPTESNF